MCSLTNILLVTICLSFVNANDGLKSEVPNLLELAKQLNLTEFVKGLEETGISHVINHEGLYTIFAPTNEAIEHEKKYPGETTLDEKISFHIARGQFKAKDIKNEVTVKTLLSHRTIRFNKYSNGKNTANGREIISTDHVAHNGVIHIINRVMSSVYHREGSVISELDECCPQHSTLRELVKIGGLYNTLDTKGPFTLLAPLDSGFDKLHPDFINHLKKNITALRSVLLSHVIPGSWYSPGLQDGQEFKTVIGYKVKVEIKKEGIIEVDKATVELEDITALNGVVHSISDVIFPEMINRFQSNFVKHISGEKFFTEQLKNLGFTSFAQALVETGLDQFLEQNKDHTVFAPSNEAFENPSSYPISFSLEDRVKFHIAKGVMDEDVQDGENMETLLDGRFVRFSKIFGGNKVRTFANGLEIDVSRTVVVDNGLMVPLVKGSFDYVYDQNGTIYHEIAKMPKFSKFLQFVKESGFEKYLVNAENLYTIFILNNQSFENLEKQMDKAVLYSKLFLRHIYTKPMHLEEMDIQTFIAGTGGRVDIRKQDGFMIIGDQKVGQGNILALNGVIHEVEGLI